MFVPGTLWADDVVMVDDGDFRRLPDGRIDGRSLRRTGRTERLAVRVTQGFSDDVKKVAAHSGLTLGQVLERGVYMFASQANLTNLNLGRSHGVMGTEMGTTAVSRPFKDPTR
jgi:hypothetical protein